VEVINLFNFSGKITLLNAELQILPGGFPVNEEIKKKKDETEVLVPLRWGPTDEIKTVYANHLIITHAGNEFYIIFGEMPPVFDLTPENAPDFLEIKPVAKISVAPENMKRFAAAIRENVEKYSKREKGSEE
jgi:hypothetical protein